MRRTTSVMAGMMLAAATAWAGDATQRMTEAKLAADQGLAEAERRFAEIADDESVPLAQRCEARVRRAAVVRQAGDVVRSLDLFESAAETCGAEREPMRLLIEALGGIEQDRTQWASAPMPLHLQIRRGAGSTFTFGYFFGDVPEPALEALATAPPYTGEPISISVKDAELSSIFTLFSQFTGSEFAVAPGIGSRKITLELVDVPWDQVLALVLQTNGLRAEGTETGWRIVPASSRSVTDPAGDR